MQMLVLAALARAGLGLESVRAVSRVAGTSPTTTATALSVLEAKGLATRQVRRVVRRVPRTATFWSANFLGDAWTERVASANRRVILPADPTKAGRGRAATRRDRRVPARFAHLFWNIDLSDVDTTRDADYVASRMLGADDVAAWMWAVDHLPESSLRRAGQIRGMPPGAYGFVENRVDSPRRVLGPLRRVAGIDVADLSDLLATKLKVIGDRGELRDYYDIEVIEERTTLTVEQGIALYVARYRPDPPEPSVAHIVRALGYLDDVADDPALPVPRARIVDYWSRRQGEVAAALDPAGRRRPAGSVTFEQIGHLLDEAADPAPAPVRTHWARRPGAAPRMR